MTRDDTIRAIYGKLAQAKTCTELAQLQLLLGHEQDATKNMETAAFFIKDARSLLPLPETWPGAATAVGVMEGDHK